MLRLALSPRLSLLPRLANTNSSSLHLLVLSSPLSSKPASSSEPLSGTVASRSSDTAEVPLKAAAKKREEKRPARPKVPVPILTPFEAMQLVRKPTKKRNFDESVEVAFSLNLDTKKENQQLRVVADLPHGTGKASRLAVFTADPAKQNAAREAGAEVVGGAELIATFAGGKSPDFEKAVATADIIPALSKIAKILGPKGLMPSKKLGTVVESADDMIAAIKRAKAGAVELRADRGGVIRAGIGKISMPTLSLVENLKAIILCVENNKPSGVKGKRIFDSLYVKSTMGNSVQIEESSVDPKNQRFFTLPISSETTSAPA